MPTLPDRDHNRMIASWQRWRLTLTAALDTVHDALEARQYETANEIMSEITLQQAQASVLMTNVLIRNGIIRGDADVD